MRKQTLASVCFILALALAFLLRALARSQGIHLPLIGVVSPLIASLIIVPLLLIPLTTLNQYILAWRKKHGRDIEAEEKHEFGESDIISLQPRQSHEEPSYRRYE
ncbi:MAG TPA: hypothetical protein VE732_07530 [Nitrososphaera sp.]|jgi:hypothetical protein|nr:hypothetical protein [Nitrososphaera sp.]